MGYRGKEGSHMYLVNIPINCDKFHRTKNKDLILDELKAFDADRVFLNFKTVRLGFFMWESGLGAITC